MKKITIYLKSGNKIVLRHVAMFTVKYDTVTGKATGYNFKTRGDAPIFINVEDIEAVVENIFTFF